MLCVRAGRARRGARRWGSRLRPVVIVLLEPREYRGYWLDIQFRKRKKGGARKVSLSLSLERERERERAVFVHRVFPFRPALVWMGMR